MLQHGGLNKKQKSVGTVSGFACLQIIDPKQLQVLVPVSRIYKNAQQLSTF